MTQHVALKNLTKRYAGMDWPAVDSVSLDFADGKIHSIIGRSGAGKTTLLRCLNLLEKPDSGEILVGEKNLLGLKEEQQRQILQSIGTIFQRFNLLSRRSVIDNILLPLEWMGRANADSRWRAIHLLEKVGLKGLENRYPSQLSGGQSQRVAIARALIADAKILLCDEFTSALDPETSLEILALLRELNRDLGVTVILITHDMSVVREVSDYVYVMERGKVVEQGDVEAVLLNPTHETTQSLLRGLFVRELPNHIQKKLTQEPCGGEVIIRLLFSGKSAQKPIIATLIEQHHLQLNILAGSLDHLRETAFGALLLGIPYTPEGLQVALQHFVANGVSPEILGYLPADQTPNQGGGQ